jgi:RNase H-like domain found in reverse transcriptase/Integrase zinc binding domain
LQEQSNARELMRFLGFANYFKEFLEDFSHRTKRLYDILRGTNVNKKKSKRVSVFVPDFEKKWTKLQRDAWQDIKDDLSSPTILTSPDRYADKMVMTDASGYGIGAVLLQRNSKTDSWRPVAFASRKLKGAETRYTVTEQECLAVVFALRKWRHYLHGGTRFEIVTDHMALRWLMSLREPRGRLARWIVEIQEFEYDRSHAPGPKLAVPDCLSRDSFKDRVTDGASGLEQESANNVREIFTLPDVADVLQGQRKDFGDIEKYAQEHEGYVIDEDGLLCREGKWRTCVVLPQDLQPQVLDDMHASPICGHYGITRTCRQIASRFWWPDFQGRCRKEDQEMFGVRAIKESRATTSRRNGCLPSN